MKYIYWLSQIQYAEQFLVGNELYILSQLLQHECPILPGFVLGFNLWRNFADAQPELSKLFQENFSEDYQTLQSVASLSRNIIAQATFPQTWQTEIFEAAQQLNSTSSILQPVVVNSSGEYHRADSLWRSHTWNNHPEALSQTIKLVWSELFNASSLLYWQRLGIKLDRVDIAILVRPLKNAFSSGLVEIDKEVIQIKATWGLSRSLLQGDVEPDRYELDRNTGYVLLQYLGNKNYGYRTKDLDITDLELPQLNCLESYIPAEHLVSTYVLSQEDISYLQELVLDVLAEQPQIKHLSWLALESPSGDRPQIYFTWLSDKLTSSASSSTQKISTSIESIEPLLSGMAVSSGSIQAKVVLIKDFNAYTGSIPAGSILVTKVIEPQHISLIKQTAGIITEIGGKTSHAAIVARELNIPAIVNATHATEILHHGDRVLLNGDDGKVYPTTNQNQSVSRHSFPATLSPTYPISTRLMVNLSQPESITAAARLPVDGVGLLRSELMLAELLSSTTLAQWQESFRHQFLSTLTNYLHQFVAGFAPRPVFYRSLDRYAEDSHNPVLGNRGTYSYLSDPTLFDLELEAISAVVTSHRNLNLILPFVRSVEEFKYCYRRIENIGLTMQDSFQVWIMAEVPSAIMLLPEYIRAGVQGIAIGTNDLTQLMLGVSREQSQFSDRGLNANHPAMQQAIAKLIETAKANNIGCHICGQAPVEYPDLIPRLIEWGIDSISVEPKAVNQTYKAIARAERRMLLEKIRNG